MEKGAGHSDRQARRQSRWLVALEIAYLGLVPAALVAIALYLIWFSFHR